MAGHKLKSARPNPSLTESNDVSHYWKRNARPMAHVPWGGEFIKELPVQWADLTTREKNLLKKAVVTGDVCVTCGNKTAHALSRKGLLTYRFGNSRKSYYDLTPAARKALNQESAE